MYDNNRDEMKEMYIFESNQLMQQLEEILLNSENASIISTNDINEIFRIMHTVKGSSSMMMVSNIAKLSHSVEDLFYFIRENNLEDFDCKKVCDIVLSAHDFIRNEILKIEQGKEADGIEDSIMDKLNIILETLKGEVHNKLPKLEKQDDSKKKIKLENKFCVSANMKKNYIYNKFIAKIHFQEGCQMENVRAFTLIHNLKVICNEIYHEPSDLFNNEESTNYISMHGFVIYLSTDKDYEEVIKNLESGLFIKSVELKQVETFDEEINNITTKEDNNSDDKNKKEHSIKDITLKKKLDGENYATKSLKQNLISVNIEKLDKLVNLVGEIVITESMVTKNPDLNGLQLNNFNKSARQLRKLTDELQDVVMSVRMLPIGPTFHKMKRIVRDMAKKFDKEVELIISGEETEVDKSIIDNLGDPLMHIIRNSMDHGIESNEIRISKGKTQKARITLEAFNTGGDVIVRISDNGRGLNKDKIIEKARKNNLIRKNSDEISDSEAYSLIMLPGFSTKEEVTEFSGRGVGMDVVKSNIEKVGGNIFIESHPGESTTISIKIPLTLAIIDGMQVRTGECIYTVPTISIRESFKANSKNLIRDTDDNEMIMIRGKCYPIVRLHRHFKIRSDTTKICEGIMIMVETETKAICLFADELIGEQQVVVKPLPGYLVQYPVKQNGIGGCTILGDGSISLIIDVMAIINKMIKGE